jgi:hypothetical protein
MTRDSGGPGSPVASESGYASARAPDGGPDALAAPDAIGLDMTSDGSCQSLLYLNASGGAGTEIGSAGVNMQAGPDLDDDVRQLAAFPPVDEWSEYRFTAVSAPDGISVTDDIVTHGRRQTTVYDYPRCHLGGRLEVGIGFHYQGESLEMHFDDVVVDWR